MGHAVNSNSVVVSVPARASIGEVKEALAKRCKEPEILKRARLGHRASGQHLITGIADSQRLGKRRVLLLMGMDLPDVKDGDEDKDEGSSEEDEPATLPQSVAFARALLKAIKKRCEMPK